MKSANLIANNVFWDQLISVCEEQANALLKVAFGALVREAGDLSAGVFNKEGKMLAQAVTGTPGHVNTMAESVRKILERNPSKELREGDVLITNDPWIGAGHIFDFVVVSPIFLKKKLIGYMASTCHIVDVGGLGWSAEGTSIYEEGILIPVSFLRRKNNIQENLIRIIMVNSRVPHEARGDILSLMSCNDAGIQRLQNLMREKKITSLQPISDFIFSQSLKSMKKKIGELKNGTYENHLSLDGFDQPIRLSARMKISNSLISVDLGKSSKSVLRGINCPLNYSIAYASFGVKAAIAPGVPNNAATLSTIHVKAPSGLIVSAERPHPVTARHVVGQALPDLVLGCLYQVIPESVPAESAGALWTISLSHEGKTSFHSLNVALGGTGARANSDGLSTTAFPSGVGTVPIEIVESGAPVIYYKKEFRENSGGMGRFRGGLGQIIEIGCTKDLPMKMSAAAFEKITVGPLGRNGGKPGEKGCVAISNGKKITNKGTYTIPKGSTVILKTPGGGGYGKPDLRDKKLTELDRENQLVTINRTNK